MYLLLAERNLNPDSPAQEQVLKYAVNTWPEYEALFKDAGDAIAVGESSTAYLANPSCIDSIRNLLPGVKIIAILRHPVDRAFSNYRMYRRWEFETRSFHKAITDEIKGLSEELPQGQKYLQLGFYSEALKQFIKVFGKERVKVYLFDDFMKRTRDSLSDLCQFLGVEQDFEFETSAKYNADDFQTHPGKRFKYFRRIDKLTKKDAKMLNNYYAEEMNSLQSLLEIDFSEWMGRY